MLASNCQSSCCVETPAWVCDWLQEGTGCAGGRGSLRGKRASLFAHASFLWQLIRYYSFKGRAVAVFRWHDTCCRHMHTSRWLFFRLYISQQNAAKYTRQIGRKIKGPTLLYEALLTACTHYKHEHEIQDTCGAFCSREKDTVTGYQR